MTAVYSCDNWKELYDAIGKMLRRFPDLAIEPVGDVSETPLNTLTVEMCEGTRIAYLVTTEDEDGNVSNF